MIARYLYRGVSPALHAKSEGLLIPKVLGAPFEYIFLGDGTIRGDGSATGGPSEQNAVLRHELRQEGFPTSGISTTPHFERACFYATNGGSEPTGYVYRIDCSRLAECNVRAYEVAKWLPSPSIPEDEEVILVAEHGLVLPKEIIAEVVEVGYGVDRRAQDTM